MRNIRWKDLLEYSALRLLIAMIKLMPYHVTEKTFEYLAVKLRKNKITRGRLAYDQIKMVFPEKSEDEIDVILKKTFRMMALTGVESYLGDSEKLLKRCRTERLEILEEALKLTKGVLLATGHFGNWELAGKFLATKYPPVGVIIKKQRNRYFNEYTNRSRNKYGIVLIYLRNSLRQTMQLLKKNGIVAILTDQNAGKNGVKLDFLGHPASVHTGIAKISQRTGSPILPAFAVRNEDGIHTFYFENLIFPEEFSNNDEGIIEITKKLINIQEKYIYRFPEQWFWVHKRWKGADKAKDID
ncbi:MAG: lysophospholipid acyltransferase family protein [Candidatus Cloacimonetes bacterium]|nr:lysophospholipid acyltransferase family protein [Candidatus Cloacimonadota bacterium]